MANKHVKCSTSDVIRELQIKKTMRYNYTSIRMVKLKTRMDSLKSWQGYGATEALIIGGKAKWNSHLEDSCLFLVKPNILFLLEKPAIMILGIYLNELKMCVYTKTCTQMFTAVLFIMAKTWEQ